MVDDSSLLRSDLRRSLLLVRSEDSDAVLWQRLNHGSYGTFDFFFVVDSVVRLAVMVVRRSESDMHSTVTFILLRVGPDDGPEGRRPLRHVRDGRDDL